MPEESVDKPTPPEAPAAPAPAPGTPAPLAIWDSLRTEMNNLFDRFGTLSLLPLPKPRGWFAQMPFGFSLPPCEFVETETGFRITAELPGLSEQEIEVAVSGDTLTLKGEKKEEKEEKTSNYYVSERAYGSFQRSFQLPKTADRDKVAASFAKGVLTITLPKLATPTEETRKVEIKGAD